MLEVLCPEFPISTFRARIVVGFVESSEGPEARLGGKRSRVHQQRALPRRGGRNLML